MMDEIEIDKLVIKVEELELEIVPPAAHNSQYLQHIRPFHHQIEQ
jgi:hypothetical protein